MKGQAQIVTSVAAVFFVAITVLVGLVIYGSVSNVTPHDRTISNESLCTTCVNDTAYTFVSGPVNNDSTLVCTNATGGQAMTNVGAGMTGGDATCLTYNIVNFRSVNVTNSSGEDMCEISNMRCDYVFDEANTLEQSFFDNNTSTTYSGFVLAAVIAIVLAAAAIVGLVMLFRA